MAGIDWAFAKHRAVGRAATDERWVCLLGALVVLLVFACDDESRSTPTAPAKSAVRSESVAPAAATAAPPRRRMPAAPNDNAQAFLAWLDEHPEVTGVSLVHGERPFDRKVDPKDMLTRARVSSGGSTTVCVRWHDASACIAAPDADHLWTAGIKLSSEQARETVVLGPRAGTQDIPQAHGEVFEFRFPEATVHARPPMRLEIPKTYGEAVPWWFPNVWVDSVRPGPKNLPALEQAPPPPWFGRSEGFSVSRPSGPGALRVATGDWEAVCIREDAWHCAELPRATLEEAHPDVCADSIRKPPTMGIEGPVVVSALLHTDTHGGRTLFVERDWRCVCTPHTPSDTKTGRFLEAWRWSDDDTLTRTGLLEIGFSRLHTLRYDEAFVSARPISDRCVDLVEVRASPPIKSATHPPPFAKPVGRYCIGTAGRFEAVTAATP